jgi:hypothetical protein
VEVSRGTAPRPGCVTSRRTAAVAGKLLAAVRARRQARRQRGLYWLGSVPRTSPFIVQARGCSSMVELQLPKLVTRVRFPSPALVFLLLRGLNRRSASRLERAMSNACQTASGLGSMSSLDASPSRTIFVERQQGAQRLTNSYGSCPGRPQALSRTSCSLAQAKGGEAPGQPRGLELQGRHLAMPTKTI